MEGGLIMPEQEIDKFPGALGNFVVSFIDILGTGEKSSAEGLLPDGNPFDSEDFCRKHYDMVESILSLQSCTAGFIGGTLKVEIDRKGYAVLTPELIHEVTMHNLGVAIIGDAVVNYVALPDAGDLGHMRRLWDLLANAGAQCLLSLVKGKPLRGGIDMAWARVISDSQILGPAFIKAFFLEKRQADYPRIVVSDELVGFLDGFCGAGTDDIPHEFIQRARMCRELLCRDEDGLYIIDYLGKPFNNYVTRQLAGLLIPVAKVFIETEFEKYKDGHDAILLHKYERLHSYLVSRLKT
jgi:hypothetical protein